jgi:outer membrane protein OmpA-like peptidoglycan-associated protein
MKNIFCFCLGLICCSTVSAQNLEFDKVNFPNQKEELREALKKVDLGTDLYTAGRKELDEQRRQFLLENKYLPISLHDYQHAGFQHFKSAVPALQEAYKFNPRNASVNYMLGLMLLFQDPLGKQTIRCLEDAIALNGTIDSDAEYWLAWACHLNSKWDEARNHYANYLKTINPRLKTNQPLVDDLNKKMEECVVGKKLSAKPERVFVDNLGPNINTAYAEYGPSISADEEKIFFTSRRSNSVGGKRDPSDNAYYEDVYNAAKVNGQWQAAKQLSKNVNTEGHDATAGLSPDGSKLYIFRSTPTDGGDLYESTLSGTEWEAPVRLNKFINTRYHESNVSLSFDGKRMYFVSRKEMGFGCSDLYYCDVDATGNWGPAKNLGPVINTKYDEDGAFMHPDGTTLYFSSKGHGSMGGFDIFKSTLINGKWQEPVNLGYPINGPDDDVFFVVSGSGNRAYFSSSKAGGFGEHDLYKITFLGPEKAPLANTADQLIGMRAAPVSNYKTQDTIGLASARLTLLKGVVRDEKTGKFLEATIDLVDNERNEILAIFKSNSSTGKYLVTLPSGKNYGMVVRVAGYLFHSENFLLPEAAEFQEFVLDFDMKRLEVGSTIALRNIFFDSDKASIRPESESELNRLIKLLKDNPGTRIEIASHTDDQGSSEFNQKLSEQRSATVVAYLVSKGVPSKNLSAKGYGESKHIAANDTEEGRQKNRRTEFKVLGK